MWVVRAIRSDNRGAASISPTLLSGQQDDVPALLAQLTTDLGPALVQSRHILLGQRPDGDPTCITQQLEGDRILLQGSPKGGAGLRLMAFYAQAPDAPLALYDWSQVQLRPLLQAEQKANAAMLAQAQQLAAVARELAAALRACAGRSSPGLAEGQEAGGLGVDLPVGAGPVSLAWPTQCLQRLRTAVAAGDASGAQVWADELAAATFGWVDLHRWLDQLLCSHLTSLDFQARCRAAFVYADSVGTGKQRDRESSLPAAGLMVAWGQNYLEVEHQAEMLFAPPETAAASVTASDLPAARWMPPEVRPAFRWLRARLSPAVQTVWDQAAATPFDRSYLANMLFRAMSSRSLDQMSLVLQRFEQCHATVTQPALMGVLFYRSGFYSSGFQWADRYDRRILDAAGEIAGAREKVARRAHQLANSLLQGWENYGPSMMTLTQSLDAGKLDCIRGTDLIGALYRNAGHGPYCVVRLRCGTTGHSVGAIPIERDGKQEMLLLDSLRSDPPGELWPTAYFKGLAWPPGYPGDRGPLFSAELYVRGLDGYLFAAGYVVRDESAGQLVQAGLPYLPGAPQPGVSRVFNGPYPSSLAGAPPSVWASLLRPSAIP